MIIISLQRSIRHFYWSALLAGVFLLSACERSAPSLSQITEYIESYRIVHDYKVASMTYKIVPEERGKFGSIQISGQLELGEPLYVEDEGNVSFRSNVAKMLRRNRFSEREINHDIYDRVIRATRRISNSENDYYTFLKVEHEPGLAINFSADLIYKKGNDGFVLDGPLRHAKLQGSPVTKFSNPVVDDTELVHKAVKNVLSEQTKYNQLMKDSRALLTQLWDNDFGFIVWNRKVPYLGDENLSAAERRQLLQFEDWRGVYHISNVKPIQYRTPRASLFFELGFYTTEGVATCLRQTGFINELTFLKSRFDQYCEFGKQYPVKIKLGSTLNETNDFVAMVQLEINGVSSGELFHNGLRFIRERNELARYSDQQRITILDESFELAEHDKPAFSLVNAGADESDRLSLKYTDASTFESSELELVQVRKKPEVKARPGDNAEPQINSKPDIPDVEKRSEQLSSQTVLVKESRSETGTANSKDSESVPLTDEVLAPASPDRLEAEDADSAKALDQEAGISKRPKPMSREVLVKATQTELKRLGVYDYRVDGIAGEYTFWSMNYVRQQLGADTLSVPSNPFLVLLQDTPTGAVKPPATPFVPSEKKKKGTLVGKAFRWVGSKFSKRKD